MVDITVRDEAITSYAGPALVIAVPAGDAALNDAACEVDSQLDGLISTLRAAGDIKGKLGETTVLHTLGKLPTARVIVVGAGDPAKLTAAGVRRMAANAARVARRAGLASFATTIYRHEDLPAATDAQLLVEGTLLGLYRFDDYRKSDPEAGDVRELIVLPRALDRAAVEEGVRRGREIGAGVTLARDLINEPPNVLTPAELARRAQAMAAEHNITCEVFDRDRMRELGMNAILSVAAGSDEPPAFIILRYSPAGFRDGAPGLCLVGKGITFDSGGISIKPAQDMHRMKGDMGGAAAVIGALRALAGLGVAGPVTAIVPTTENLLGGRAMTPGDIVKAMNGVSIEIINTDAEGRLVLADALSYAVREGFAPLVDVATLTGAANVALGPFYTAVFASDDGTAASVLDAANTAGEKMWRMPLDDAFEELIKSDAADIKNSAVRSGGAVTAAMFLRHFVGDKPWAHLDIAPTSWSDKDEGEQTKGGSGAAVRTLVALAEAMAAR